MIYANMHVFWAKNYQPMSGTGPGRVFVDAVDIDSGTALVRYDAGEGIRSRQYCAKLADLQVTKDGWKS